MSDGLKPCPFCGGERVRFIYNIDLEPDGITCNACQIIVRYPRIKVKGNERFGVAMDKMRQAWNRREVTT